MFDFNWWRKTPVMWQGKEYKNIFHLPDGGQVLPVCIVRQLLYPISSNEFLDVINAHSNENIHMCTVCENDFLRYEYAYIEKFRFFYFDEYGNFIINEDFKRPTFKQYTDEQIIELEDFISWIHRNKEYVISLKGRLIDEYASTVEESEEYDQGQGVDAEQTLALRKELEDTKAKLQDALEGHGLLSEVLKRKIEGEPWEKTKAWLQSLGLSGSNIGLFLREKVLGDEGYRAAARNGKPKK